MLSLLGFPAPPPLLPAGMVSVCEEALCVLRRGKAVVGGSDSHRDCGYIQYPQKGPVALAPL